MDASLSASSSDPRVKRWQRLLNADAPRQLESIEITNSNIFADQTIDFSRVTAVIGRHGTGKSLLLRTIEALFGYITPSYAPPFLEQNSQLRKYSVSHPSGEFRVKVRSPQGVIVKEIDLQVHASDRAREWESLFAAYYATPIAAFSDIDYMFDNYHPRALASERDATRMELDAIRNIVGRSYEKLTYRTLLSDTVSGVDYYNLFVSGIEGGREVNSWTMSQGELWVHHVLGHFLSHDLDNECIALLDEPETFLANAAQRPFIDQVAREILKRKAQLIVGTHSFEMLNRFPLANIRLCLRLNGKIHIVQPTTFSMIKDSLGVDSPTGGVILVEDAFAADVLKSLFSIYDVALSRDAEIVPCDGESGVRSTIRSLRHARRIHFVGVLDGDQRNSGSHLDADPKTILYLPGRSSPEQELMSSVLRYPRFFSELSGRSLSDVLAAVDACISLDHQYQIDRFARHLGFPVDVATAYLVRTELQDAQTEQEARDLVMHIRACITGRV
ncbi:ATP-dependent endonuclease [Nonomuraea sp. JJY05]|uniref:ATP-dependent nuclease n=1 Tax=Nonomuraea sp. JJY05 TaxID=3350255 RepID=UPI00373E3AFC